MIKVLHLADVHLDTAFEGRTKALRAHLRDALRTALRRAVDCALDEAVDAVLIAGDLFDDERLSFSTERFLVQQMQRLHEAAIPCVYVTGNHDPGGQAHRAASINWPPSFRYIDTPEPTVITLADEAGNETARVVAAGHESAREHRNLAAGFPPATNGVPHIGLLHAQVTSATGVERHDRYAPCTLDDLQAANYAYWALGHIHIQQQVDGAENAWYAGNLQGRHSRETGPKGGLLVTIDAGHVTVAPRAFAPTQWAEVHLDALEDVTHVQALEDRIRTAHRDEACDAARTDWLLRVTLSGACPLAAELRTAEQRRDLAETLTEALGVLEVEVRTRHLTPPVDPDAHRGDVHLLGEVLDLIDRLHDDPALRSEVMPEPLAGLSTADRDDPEARDRYLRQLLDGLDREAVSRLLAREP